MYIEKKDYSIHYGIIEQDMPIIKKMKKILLKQYFHKAIELFENSDNKNIENFEEISRKYRTYIHYALKMRIRD